MGFAYGITESWNRNLSIGFLYSPAYTTVLDEASPMENINIMFEW